MPYYLYRITERPVRLLEMVAQFPAFKTASAEAKRLRAEGAESEGVVLKVIFAENELKAEDMLSQVRQPPLLVGDDL